MPPPVATPAKRRQKTIWVVGLTVLALIGGIWLFTKPEAEPAYNGERLSVWLQLLGTPERTQAEAAIKAMRPKAVPFLIAQLKDRNPDTGLNHRYREFYNSQVWSWPNWLHSCLPEPKRIATPWGRMTAATALGHLGDTAIPAIPHLVAALSEEEHPVSWAASEALIKIGPATAPPLVRKLDCKDDSSARQITRIIIEVGRNHPDIVPVLVAALRENDTVKLRVLELLPTIGDHARAAERDINPFLNSANPELRCAAVFALWELIPERHIELMEHFAGFATLTDEPVRLRAGSKLAQMQPFTVRAAEILAPLLEGSSESSHWSIYEDLARGGCEASNAAPIFLTGLKSTEPRIAGKAAEGLGKIGTPTPEVLKALQAVQDNEYRMVRIAAKEALATLQSQAGP